MPELPDITVYVEALERRIAGETLEQVRIQAPFLLRTFDPPIDARSWEERSERFGGWASGSRSGLMTICGSCCIS